MRCNTYLKSLQNLLTLYRTFCVLYMLLMIIKFNRFELLSKFASVAKTFKSQRVLLLIFFENINPLKVRCLYISDAYKAKCNITHQDSLFYLKELKSYQQKYK